MFESIVTIGDKLHVATRPGFAGDARRHFMGEVVGNTGSLCELDGRAVVRESDGGAWNRLPERRRRILSLADANHVVHRIPRDVDLDALTYEPSGDGIVITDGKEFGLTLTGTGEG